MTQANLEPRQLALVITDLHAGGAERCCAELAIRLNQSGYCCEVYSLFPPPPTDKQRLVDILRTSKVPVHFLNATSLWSLPRVIRRLRQELRRQQPHVVQSFLFHANFCTALARRGLETVFVGGIRVAEPRKLHLRLARCVDRYVDHYVCVSESVARYSRDAGGLAAEKLEVIPNGIDAAEYVTVKPIDLQQLGLPEGRRAICFVGRLERQKGVDWLLHQAPNFLAAHPLHDLLLVGTGCDQAKLVSMVERAGIKTRVHFAGWRNDVPALIAASDVIVLPSRWEGMPNVILEAMASGKPVLASAVEGVAELLGAGSDAQTFAVEDADAFAQKLQALLTLPELYVKIAAENSRRACAEFPFSAMAKKYDHLYTSLLSRRASNR